MLDIAIVGMALRVPGANDPETFWHNLCAGAEAIRVPISGRDRCDEVRASAMLDDYDRFDAAFFGFSAKDAELMDPQHRVLLECSWAALERAGFGFDREGGRTGVWAGATMNSYLLCNLMPAGKPVDDLDPASLNILSGADFLATRLAFKITLT